MKLRIQGNSIRMRITQGELNEMANNGVVRDTISFAGGSTLTYSLVRDAACESPSAAMAGNTISICLPSTAVDEWISTEQVSLRGTQNLDGGSDLIILVEKDFACLQPRENEDESDMFPHPDEESC